MRIVHPFTRPRSVPRPALRSACTLLVLVLALAACGSASGPDGVEGSYSARAVNGERPPVDVWGTAGVGTLQVVDADVRLRAGGEVSVELTTRMSSINGTSPGQGTTYVGRFTQSGDVLQMGYLQDAEGRRVSARGVVISSREIAVTLMFQGSAYTGFYQYPVSLIARR